MMNHMTFEQLCDLSDGVLSAGEELTVREHLTSCAECAARFSALGALGEQAAALPRDIAPPAELWNDIQRVIAKSSIIADISPTRTSWRSTSRLAAAAVLIAISSSAITMYMTRGREVQPTGIVSQVTVPQLAVLPARLASAEHGYELSVTTLQRTLAERRDSLAPSTVAIVERSIRVADSAIAEAREALARDPANIALARLFASNYERKIDLLKRATELTPRT